jgi:hypothetical protein
VTILAAVSKRAEPLHASTPKKLSAGSENSKRRPQAERTIRTCRFIIWTYHTSLTELHILEAIPWNAYCIIVCCPRDTLQFILFQMLLEQSVDHLHRDQANKLACLRKFLQASLASDPPAANEVPTSHAQHFGSAEFALLQDKPQDTRLQDEKSITMLSRRTWLSRMLT